MKTKGLGLLAGLLTTALAVAIGCRDAAAEVIAVPSGDSATVPTQTFYWEGRDAKAVLLLIPGGEGHINLRPEQTDVRAEFYLTLKQLSLGQLNVGSGADGIFDVVLFSNPAPIAINPRGYPSGRASRDHLSRIRSVIEFYREKTQKPVWLMGHSNGAVSVTEYLRYERKLGQPSLVAGLIVSGARYGTYFDSTPLNLPVLFLHNRHDGCRDAPPAASFANFEKVKALNTAPTSFVYIETGGDEGRNPCDSGYHMYHGAAPEVSAALRSFMVRFGG